MPDTNTFDQEFEELAWQNMKRMLDEDMPEKKRRFAAFFWLLGLVGAVALAIVGWNYASQEANTTAKENTPMAQADDAMKPGVSQEAGLNKSVEIKNTENNNGAEQDVMVKAERSGENGGGIKSEELGVKNEELRIKSEGVVIERITNEELRVKNGEELRIKNEELRVENEEMLVERMIAEEIKNEEIKIERVENEEIVAELEEKEKEKVKSEVVQDILELRNVLLVELLPSPTVHVTSAAPAASLRIREVDPIWTETIPNVLAQGPTHSKFKFGVGAHAQSDVNSVELGWLADGRVGWYPHPRVGLVARVDYGALRTTETFLGKPSDLQTSLDIPELDDAVYGGSSTSDTLDHLYTRKVRSMSLGLGLGTELYVLPKLSVEAGVTYRITTNAHITIKDETIPPEEESVVTNVPPIEPNAIVDRTSAFDRNYANLWTARANLNYEIAPKWKINIGIEKYYYPVDNQFSVNLDNRNVNFVQTPNTNASTNTTWVANAGLSYTF